MACNSWKRERERENVFLSLSIWNVAYSPGFFKTHEGLARPSTASFRRSGLLALREQFHSLETKVAGWRCPDSRRGLWGDIRDDFIPSWAGEALLLFSPAFLLGGSCVPEGDALLGGTQASGGGPPSSHNEDPAGWVGKASARSTECGSRSLSLPGGEAAAAGSHVSKCREAQTHPILKEEHRLPIHKPSTQRGKGYGT